MEFPCPSCDHPLNIARNLPVGDASDYLETLTGVDCPNCGFVPLASIPGVVQEPDGMGERTLTFAAEPDYVQATQIGHFRLLRLLGQGGFGSVWLAEDVNLGRHVALKLPISRKRDLSSLLHEAQASAHLRHPNIVSVYEVGTEANQVFIACEYVDGLTLRDLLSAGTPAISRTVDTLITVCDALQYAHGQGIVHRDVKPANILLTKSGAPFVADFGLAKRVSAHTTESTISSEGQVLGTARYMSPEQASGKTRETDHRSDIYAVGVILFEMLTGHVPFRGNMRAVLHQKIFEDAPSPRSLDPLLPRDLETICVKCLERDPEKRYASAGDVAAELVRFRNGEPILARPISSAERGWRWCRRHPTITLLMASLLVSLTVGLTGVSFYSVRASRNATLLRESLYRSQMSLAAEYVAHGDVPALNSALNSVTQDAETAKLREFAWYYYHHFAGLFLQVIDHGDAVTAISLSADGRQLASAGADREVHIWSTTDGTLLRTLTAAKGRFRSIEFSPTRGQLATGSSDGFVRLWNPAKEGEPLQQMKHGPPVAFVRFSPNGRLLMTAGANGALRLWDVDAETLQAEIPTGKSGTMDVRFSPDGRLIAVATDDGRVRLRDVDSHEIVRELEPNPSVRTLAISDDSQTLVTGSYNGTLRVWSLTDGTLRFEEESNYGLIGDLMFLKDSPLLAIVATSGELLLVDTDSGQEVRSLPAHYLSEGVLARSASGDLLAIGSGDGKVKLLTPERLAEPDICWHEAHIRGLEFLDDQRLLAASGDGAVIVWHVAEARGETLIAAGESTLTQMVVHPPTGRVAIATADPAVQIYDLQSRDNLQRLDSISQGVAALQFSPGGEMLAVVQRDQSVALITLETPPEGPESQRIEFDSQPSALEFSNDGLQLMIAREDGQVSKFDRTGAEVAGWSFQIDEVPRCLEWCPFSNLLAIGTDAGSIDLWDVSSAQHRGRLKAHTSRINMLRVLPNGRTLVSGGRDRELRLWDTVSLEMVTALKGHSRQVFSIAPAPNGELLATGDLLGAIRLWWAPRRD